MNRGKLAIVGASARAAVFSALRAGISPVAADLFADADLQELISARAIASCDSFQDDNGYPDIFLPWLEKTSPAAWLYTGGLENYPELIDRMERVAPLLGNAASTLRKVRCPLLLQRLLQEHNLLFPETRSAAELVTTPFTEVQKQWLVKTYKSSSGFGTKIYSHTQQMRQENQDETFLQKYVSGKPGAALFVATESETLLLGITYQLVGTDWTHAKTFQYAGSIGPWDIGEEAAEQLKRAGNTLTKAFGLRGIFGVDFILQDSNVWVLEVNPRYTASVEIVERFQRCSAIGLHLAAFIRHVSDFATEENRLVQEIVIDTPIEPQNRTNNRFFGKAILFAPQEVVVSNEFTNSLTQANQYTLEPRYADIPLPETFLHMGAPVVTVFAEGTSLSQVNQRLQARLAELERKLYP